MLKFDHNKKLRAGYQRRQSGQGIVEGVVGLVLVILVVVAAVLTIISVGMMTYYQEKVAFVTGQAAEYASSLMSWCNNYNYSNIDDVQTKTKAMVDDVLNQIGLPASKSVLVSDTGNTAVVTVAVEGLKLQSLVKYLPAKISIQDTASASLAGDQPPALLCIFPAGDKTKMIAVPAYGIYQDNVSDGSKGPNPKRSTDVTVLRDFELPYNSFYLGNYCKTSFQLGSGPPTKFGNTQTINSPNP